MKEENKPIVVKINGIEYPVATTKDEAIDYMFAYGRYIIHTETAHDPELDALLENLNLPDQDENS